MAVAISPTLITATEASASKMMISMTLLISQNKKLTENFSVTFQFPNHSLPLKNFPSRTVFSFPYFLPIDKILYCTLIPYFPFPNLFFPISVNSFHFFFLFFSPSRNTLSLLIFALVTVHFLGTLWWGKLLHNENNHLICENVRQIVVYPKDYQFPPPKKKKQFCIFSWEPTCPDIFLFIPPPFCHSVWFFRAFRPLSLPRFLYCVLWTKKKL